MPSPPDAQAPEVSVVVANWQGADWIERCLSSLQVSAWRTRRRVEIIVVDDASTDGSPDVIRARFPRVRLLVNPQNAGFRRTVMRGVAATRGRVLVLANNDLVALEDFLPNLTRWFFDAESTAPRAGRLRGPLFAVSARTVSWHDGRPNQLCMGALWRGGRITPAWLDPPKPHPCLFVQAGAAAYDRALFLRLGGLAPHFEPGYWEDYDLSFRAARRGWAQLYDPEATALHVGGGSMTRRFGAEGVATMRARNHLVFDWLHLRSGRLLLEHFARLPLALARDGRGGGPALFRRAFREALGRLPELLRARLTDRTGGLHEHEILAPWRDFTPSG